jgi:hypothetical protein
MIMKDFFIVFLPLAILDQGDLMAGLALQPAGKLEV